MSRHFADATGVNIFLGMEFTPSNSVVSLPRHLLRRAPHTIELHPLGTWRHVNNSPVFGRTVVAFADVATVDGSLIVEVGFLGDFKVVSGAVHAARRGTGGAPGRSTAGRTTRVVLDEYVFIELSAVARAAGGELGQRWNRRGKRTGGEEAYRRRISISSKLLLGDGDLGLGGVLGRGGGGAGEGAGAGWKPEVLSALPKVVV